MTKGNRRIFYDKTTGDIIYAIGRSGYYKLPTVDQDILTFTVLSERNRDSFDVVEMDYEHLINEFTSCTNYRVNPTTKEIEFNYDPAFTLEEYKAFKIVELDKACTKTILGRFKCVINNIEYEFSYDMESQSRFNGVGLLFYSGKITEIEWTAYENGNRTRITLTQTEFDTVSMAALVHQDSNIKKYNSLLPIVNNATTKEEVEAIVW